MQERTVNVELGDRRYPIHIGAGLCSTIGSRIAGLREPGNVALISDETVAGLYGDVAAASLDAAGFAVTRLVVPPGEASKSLTVASRLYDDLAAARLDRSGLIVALGGGVVGDLAGFVAATWLRGVPFVQVPTTLEADIDASVGGKTAVNHTAGKNMVGAFHQPIAVLIDTECLATLSARDFVAGLAESVKHGIIRDADFLAWHESHAERILAREPDVLAELIERNCAIKAAVVAEDEREETGIRASLNFGHTIGHAVEARLGYQLRHGECVSIGTVAALAISRQRGMVAETEVDRITRLLDTFGLPTRVPADHGLSVDDLLTAARHDKKVHAGAVRFVLLAGVGQVEFLAVDDADLRAGIAAIGV